MKENAKKGITPWNKGLKTGKPAWNSGTKGVMKVNKGSFKKGVSIPKSENWKEMMRIKMLGKNLGRKHTPEIKEKLRASHVRGEKHPAWKGGVTPLHEQIRKSLEYKLWRESVFKRDNFTCVFCGKRGGTKHADHIKPFCAFPELRFAIDNGRTLCVSCHRKTDTYGARSKKHK